MIPLREDGSDLSKRDHPALLRRLVSDFERRPLNGKPNALDRRLDWLAETTGMAEIERHIIGITARVAIFDVWSSLAQIVSGNLASDLSAAAIASLAGISSVDVDRHLQPGAFAQPDGAGQCGR
ncbi:hypothetical protein G7A66_11125 [Altererythrobacter sp. SALINAS58]|uniref:hypothetical protein n=1 Tax=Alteripontixanthobacter muriae TaxID=2705546 RepID=UPI0015762B6C|nr:hypothetical protein [Alteripontixanthobacter muriae]NTZ43624.1 hypothetical protein [Alteripontixanthobacter muriae]